jgi:hypothetical protein
MPTADFPRSQLHQCWCILLAARTPEEPRTRLADNPEQTVRLQAVSVFDASNAHKIPVRRSRWLKLGALSGLGLGLATVFLFAFFWPFRLDTVAKELADESDSKVTAGSFHATYFPHPGCVLEQVVFQHNPKN